jgi:hypothetical protein
MQGRYTKSSEGINMKMSRRKALNLVTASICMSVFAPVVALGADRPALNEFGGDRPKDDANKRDPVTVNDGTRVTSVVFFTGDRINGIVLRGADGSKATFKGSKKPEKEQKPIVLNDGEYLIGFRGLWSDGTGPIPKVGTRKGWFKAQAIIGTPNGERRYSDDYGTGGLSNLHLGSAGKIGVTLSVGMHDFEILAPDGYEVVGLHGSAGEVLDYVGLIVQKR